MSTVCFVLRVFICYVISKKVLACSLDSLSFVLYFGHVRCADICIGMARFFGTSTHDTLELYVFTFFFFFWFIRLWILNCKRILFIIGDCCHTQRHTHEKFTKICINTHHTHMHGSTQMKKNSMEKKNTNIFHWLSSSN